MVLHFQLRQARQLNKLSLDEAATRAGITGGYLSRIERGFAPLKPDLADRLAQIYQIPAWRRITEAAAPGGQ